MNIVNNRTLKFIGAAGVLLAGSLAGSLALATGTTGKLRLMHLAVFPDGANSAVEVFVDGEPSGVRIAFKQGTDYVELPAGSYDLDLVPVGGTIADSVFAIEDFELGKGDMWEIVAAGYVEPEAQDDAEFGVFAFPEDHEEIHADATRFNVFHLAALGDLSPVDVWILDEACEPVHLLLPEFEFGHVAADIDVPVGPLLLGFDLGQDETVDACFRIPELGAGIVVNAFAVSDATGEVSLLAHLPDGGVVELDPA